MRLFTVSHLMSAVHNRPLQLMFLLAGSASALVLWNISSTYDRTVEVYSVQHASQFSSAIREFRTLYTSEVVERLVGHNVPVTHNYSEVEGAIPLPATLSIKLGQHINAEDLGASVKLYSPFPFPDREGGLPDAFSQEAWSRLKIDPDTPVYEFEETPAGLRLRYATADLMREKCVRCHNTHPDTPRNDWKVGDLRGVLDVTLSLEEEVAEASAAQHRSYATLTIVGLIGLLGLALVVNTHHSTAKFARGQAAMLQVNNTELLEEIRGRELAEQEQSNLEEQILQVRHLESLGMLAGGVAHDFNNLLTPILGNSDLVRKQVPPGSAARDAIDDIHTAATTAAELCQGMLAFSGKRSTALETLDIRTIVEEMDHLLMASISKGCVIEYDLPPGLPLISGVKSQIRQMILSVVINASEAIGDDFGVIRVRSFAGEGLVHCETDTALDYLGGAPCIGIEIIDSGCGMSAETRARVFDPFFTTKFTGRGLGLAAVSGIVKAHRGAITVSSELGCSTRVKIAFPVKTPGAGEHVESSEVEEESRCTEKLLLVGDEPHVLRLSERILRDDGFEVLTARNGQEAVRAFEENASALVCVVLDLSAPGIGSAGVLRRIQRDRPDIPLVLCSSSCEAEVSRRFEYLRSSRIVKKPFQPPHLIAAVRASLEAAHDRRLLPRNDDLLTHRVEDHLNRISKVR